LIEVLLLALIAIRDVASNFWKVKTAPRNFARVRALVKAFGLISWDAFTTASDFKWRLMVTRFFG